MPLRKNHLPKISEMIREGILCVTCRELVDQDTAEGTGSPRQREECEVHEIQDQMSEEENED